jgi:hypothetical protein
MVLIFRRAACALAALCWAFPAVAQSHFEENFDDAAKSWQEVAIQLPAPPSDASLLPFSVSGNATQNFAVDANSLSIGEDGVVRYTLVATSPSGARNVSYEGIRCETFERKSYAYGHADGTWSRSRRDQWTPIVRNTANRQHAVLAQDFFCDANTVAGKRDMILQRMRRDQPINPRSGG